MRLEGRKPIGRGTVLHFISPMKPLASQHFPQVSWYRDGELVDHSFTTSGNRESVNVHQFVAAAEHNAAVFRCEAANRMSAEPMAAEIVLAVQCESRFA